MATIVLIGGSFAVAQVNQRALVSSRVYTSRVYKLYEGARAKAALSAKQDLMRVTQLATMAQQGKVSSHAKATTILPNGHVQFPDVQAMTNARKLCQDAVQIAQGRLLRVTSTASQFIPELSGEFEVGDVGMLQGEATITKLEAGQMVIKGRLGSRVHAVKEPNQPQWPMDLLQADSADALLDGDLVDPPERTVYLLDAANKGLAPDGKVKLDRVGVIVEGKQLLTTAAGKQEFVFVLRVADLAGAVADELRAREEEIARRKKEREDANRSRK